MDKRKKYNRILTAHNGLASAGRLYIRHEHVDFLEQFGQYPQSDHDDILDASSMALAALEGLYVDDSGNMRAANELNEVSNLDFINVQVAP